MPHRITHKCTHYIIESGTLRRRNTVSTIQEMMFNKKSAGKTESINTIVFGQVQKASNSTLKLDKRLAEILKQFRQNYHPIVVV